jgi:hypothetical protein
MFTRERKAAANPFQSSAFRRFALTSRFGRSLNAELELAIRVSKPIYIDIADLAPRLNALNSSEFGIGRFSRELRLVFRPVALTVSQRGKKKV